MFGIILRVHSRSIRVRVFIQSRTTYERARAQDTNLWGKIKFNSLSQTRKQKYEVGLPALCCTPEFVSGTNFLAGCSGCWKSDPANSFQRSLLPFELCGMVFNLFLDQQRMVISMEISDSGDSTETLTIDNVSSISSTLNAHISGFNEDNKFILI